MYGAIASVLEFHHKMGLTIGNPASPDLSQDTKLRFDLIKEEFDELKLALKGLNKHDQPLNPEEQVIEVADALGDLIYVITGAAITWGIDLAGVFDAIHASNMTKIPGNKRSDGKILKGPEYQPPKIREALANSAQDYQGQQEDDPEDIWWPTPTPLTPTPEATEDTESTDINPFPEALLENPKAVHGQFLARGAYVFECVNCSRTHEMSLLNGSRGGRASTGHAECMCGLVYDASFSIQNGEDHADITIKDLGGIG